MSARKQAGVLRTAITNQPLEDVAAAGDDRCIFPIKPAHINEWLRLGTTDKSRLFKILADSERPTYKHRMAGDLRTVAPTCRARFGRSERAVISDSRNDEGRNAAFIAQISPRSAKDTTASPVTTR